MLVPYNESSTLLQLHGLFFGRQQYKSKIHQTCAEYHIARVGVATRVLIIRVRAGVAVMDECRVKVLKAPGIPGALRVLWRVPMYDVARIRVDY